MLQTLRPDSITIAGITWGRLSLWLELRREITPKGDIVCTARAVVLAFPEAGRIVKGQRHKLGFSIGDESWETDSMTVTQSKRVDKGHGRDYIVVTLSSCAEAGKGGLDAFHKLPCDLELRSDPRVRDWLQSLRAGHPAGVPGQNTVGGQHPGDELRPWQGGRTGAGQYP